MKFKTKRDSETGKRLTELKKKADDSIQLALDLIKGIGASSFRSGYWTVWGGISSIIFDKDAEVPIYMKKNKYGEYIPNRSKKEGKEFQKKINSLPTVSFSDLNECVRFNGTPFQHIGISFSNPDFYLFSLNDSWKYEAPIDCEEITVLEYTSLL